MEDLSNSEKDIPKADFPFTVVKIISMKDGKHTDINIIDSKYSINGVVVKEEILPSFEGEWSALYLDMLSHYTKLAQRVDQAVRAGRIC